MTNKDVQDCIEAAPSYIALIQGLKVSQDDIDAAVDASEEYGKPIPPQAVLLQLSLIIDKYCEENEPEAIDACLKEHGYPMD